MKYEQKDIAKLIDQTFLKKDARDEEIKKVCEETKRYGFRGLCGTLFRRRLLFTCQRKKKRKNNWNHMLSGQIILAKK